MSVLVSRAFRTLLVTLPLLLTTSAAYALSNKWRIEFSEGANSDGTIVFEVSYENTEKILVTVEIDDGTSENNVARQAVRAFKDQLPEGKFHVERDDGEDVLIKRKHGQSRFDLRLVSKDIDGVRVRIERE